MVEPLKKAEKYVHPDTGETVEIPKGAVVLRIGDWDAAAAIEGAKGKDGEIVQWRNPPVTPEGELHPDQVEGYEPRFDRRSAQRFALGSITDEVDIDALGPRNSVAALSYFLALNSDVPAVNRPSVTALRLIQPTLVLDLPAEQTAEAQVEALLVDLVGAGLVEERDDGTYAVTDAGRVELGN